MFGLCNAPATFERMKYSLLRRLKWTMLHCYLRHNIMLDNVRSPHHSNKECFGISSSSWPYIQSKKVKILGQLVSSYGTRPHSEKGKSISNFMTPMNIHDIRSFLWLFLYIRRFINGFFYLTESFNIVLKCNEKFYWDHKMVKVVLFSGSYPRHRTGNWIQGQIF